DKTSVFSIIEAVLAVSGAAVVCDDLGNEWADHIRFMEGSDPSIEFVHSKWAEGPTNSASAFHDLASQAIKNLGNLTSADKKMIASKIRTWNEDYTNTRIPRMRTGIDSLALQQVFERLANGLSTKRVMSLVAPFLSKAQFLKNVDALGATRKLPAYAN